jgi:hypothetical protein
MLANPLETGGGRAVADGEGRWPRPGANDATWRATAPMLTSCYREEQNEPLPIPTIAPPEA